MLIAERSPRLSSRDVGAHRTRNVVGMLTPTTVSEVRDIVRGAAAERRHLYPISTGRNWGMGSARPVSDDNVVVDLSHMRRIRNIDLENGYAVVEPGVTQAQLAEALTGSPWLLNVTSSCADTSVIGNALERGDGTVRSRVHDVAGIEVVLADGTLVTTGGLSSDGRYRGRTAGPDLTQAFVQSNLGIVTAMAVALVPRPPATGLVHVRLPDEHVAMTMTALAGFLRRGNPCNGLVRVRELCLVPKSGRWLLPGGAGPGRFTVVGSLLGTADAVVLGARLLREALAGIPGARSLKAVDAETIGPEDPLYARALMARGIPTCRSLHGALGVGSCAEVDEGAIGFLVQLPLVPMTATGAHSAVLALQEAVDTFPTALMMEWNLVSTQIANGVVQAFFDHADPDAPGRAHLMRDLSGRLLRSRGAAMYRSDIDHAAATVAEQTDVAGLDLLRRVKATLDPAGLIAPGRYLPRSGSPSLGGLNGNGSRS